MKRLIVSLALAGAPLMLPVVAYAQQAIEAQDSQRVAELAFKRALTLAERGDWVFALAEGQAAGEVGSDIIEWLRLRAGEGTLEEEAAFVGRHPDWPGLDLIQRRGEEKLTNAAPADVVKWFSNTKPTSVVGIMALLQAQNALGLTQEMADTARATWAQTVLTEPQQAAFLSTYGAQVAEDHPARLRNMLDRGYVQQAQQMLPLVDPDLQALANARIALQRRASGVDALIVALPDAQRADSGLALDRAVWRWRVGMEDGANEIVLQYSKNAETLGDPSAWAVVRGQLARFALKRGDTLTAYRLAARNRLPAQGETWADLEWLAGYAALRLSDAPTALKHFDALAKGVSSPISAARAAYWRGRALHDMGRLADARKAWQQGAQWQTAFYGLLSAEKLGYTLDPQFSWPPSLPKWDDAPFVSGSLFQAAMLLHRVGDERQARRFVLQIEENNGADSIPQLTAMAQNWGDTKLALTLAKRAVLDGQVMVQAYYPLPSFSTTDLGIPEELALSITRRESEFDPEAVSFAGARGLMQLMPATAQLMAPVIGETFEQGRLTADPIYNVRLGSAYLKRLRDEFGTSPILVAAGYNAGPGRPRAWINDMGDPRSETTDIVDWIEMIPFSETRNYVMRVSEALPVYRARLGADMAGPITFTQELRGSPAPQPNPLPVEVTP